jgi:hypothetical protein
MFKFNNKCSAKMLVKSLLENAVLIYGLVVLNHWEFRPAEVGAS